MAVRTYIEAIRESLAEEMRRDASIVVLGEDVGRKGGVFLATDGLHAEFGADRVVDTPLTESMIVGVSIGAAANGIRPVAEIQFADFIFPAFNQIVSEAARMRYRSNGAFGCPITIRAPYGGGVHGALYHSQSVEAFFTHVPGLKVVIPSTPYDAKGLLKSAIRDENPVIFIEAETLYPVKGEVPEDPDFTIPLGVAEVKREGRDVTVLAYSRMYYVALEVADELDKEGISVEIIDPRTLRPLDKETMLASVRKTHRAVLLEAGAGYAGMGAEFAAILAEEAFDDLDAPIERVTGANAPMPYARNLEKLKTPSKHEIIEAIRKVVS